MKKKLWTNICQDSVHKLLSVRLSEHLGRIITSSDKGWFWGYFCDLSHFNKTMLLPFLQRHQHYVAVIKRGTTCFVELSIRSGSNEGAWHCDGDTCMYQNYLLITISPPLSILAYAMLNLTRSNYIQYLQIHSIGYKEFLTHFRKRSIEAQYSSIYTFTNTFCSLTSTTLQRWYQCYRDEGAFDHN